jgi:hypothetical protein
LVTKTSSPGTTKDIFSQVEQVAAAAGAAPEWVYAHGLLRSKSTGLESHRFNHANACQNHLVSAQPHVAKPVAEKAGLNDAERAPF